MGIMPSFLKVLNGFLIPNPPMNRMPVISYYFCQCSCPASTSNDSNSHAA